MIFLRNSFILFLLFFCGNKIVAQCPKSIGDTIVFSGIHSNLGAWYPLNGNAKDSSGFGNDGTVYHAYPAPDRFGNTNMAYQFNGKDNYIRIPSNSAHQPKDSLTVSAWVYMDDSVSVWHMIVSKRIARNNYPSNSYILYGGSPNSSQYAVFGLSNNSSEVGADKTNGIHTKRWYMFTGTYNRTKSGNYKAFFYVNGVLVDSSQLTGQINYNNSNPLNIGESIDNTNPSQNMKGRIDDVRVYQKDLCKQEVKYLYGDHLILDVKTKSQNTCLGVGDSTLVYIINPEPNIKYSLCDAKDSLMVKGYFYSKCDDTLKFYAVNKSAGMSYLIKAENGDGSCKIFLDKTIGFSSSNANFSISNTTPCQNEKVQLSVSNPSVNTTYLWKINSDTSSGNNIDYAPQNFGNNQIKLIYEFNDNGNTCKDSIEKTLFVKEKPNVNFTVNKLEQCLKKNEFFFTNLTIFSDTNLLNFIWKSGYNIGTSNYKNFNYSYASAGTFKAVLIAEANNNCKDSLEVLVTVLPSPDVSFTVNKSVQCLDSQNFFVKTNPSSDYKKWTWSDGTSFDNIDSSYHQFSTFGNYTIKLFAISTSNCVDSSIRNLEVNPVPMADFETDTVCFEEFTEFKNTSKIDAGNISKYDWQIETKNYITQQVSHQFSKHGNFDVKLKIISDKFCVAETVKNVVVKEKPIASFIYKITDDGILGNRVDLTNTSQNALKYFWNINNSDQNTLENISRNYFDDSITLHIRLISINDQVCSDTFYQLIYLETKSDIYIPNAFSPNTDEHNPVFKPIGIYKTLSYDFQVYNRWGQLVFQTDDFTKGWDGTFKNTKAENGIYIYRIFYRGMDKKQKNFKGNVQLIR